MSMSIVSDLYQIEVRAVGGSQWAPAGDAMFDSELASHVVRDLNRVSVGMCVYRAVLVAYA